MCYFSDDVFCEKGYSGCELTVNVLLQTVGSVIQIVLLKLFKVFSIFVDLIQFQAIFKNI